MADDKKQYVTALGFVQFDPNQREANGKQVTDIVIKTPGGDSSMIRITIWPEFKLDEPVQRGDFVAVDGTFSTSSYQGADGSPKTSNQISPYSLNINGKRIERAEREVVTSSKPNTDVPF